MPWITWGWAGQSTFLSSAIDSSMKRFVPPIEARAERATSELGSQTAETRALVAGLQFEPLPFVELRPEYRYLVTDDYTLGQYTLQLHLFF